MDVVCCIEWHGTYADEGRDDDEDDDLGEHGPGNQRAVGKHVLVLHQPKQHNHYGRLRGEREEIDICALQSIIISMVWYSIWYLVYGMVWYNRREASDSEP